MSEMIAYCGLLCSECPALLATRADDDARRADVAAKWSEEFNTNLKPTDINCEGCLSEDGVLFRHCQVCEIRSCGMSKGVANCAFCSEYACDRLAKFFAMVPEAQARLDGLRS